MWYFQRGARVEYKTGVQRQGNWPGGYEAAGLCTHIKTSKGGPVDSRVGFRSLSLSLSQSGCVLSLASSFDKPTYYYFSKAHNWPVYRDTPHGIHHN